MTKYFVEEDFCACIIKQLKKGLMICFPRIKNATINNVTSEREIENGSRIHGGLLIKRL
jgi:hypothetical protein